MCLVAKDGLQAINKLRMLVSVVLFVKLITNEFVTVHRMLFVVRMCSLLECQLIAPSERRTRIAKERILCN